MNSKKNIKKVSYKKIIIIALAVAVVFSSGFFCDRNIAEAKKKKAKSSVTKWQKMLERNNVDRALWQKYLPKVSRKEYGKVTKLLKKLGQISGGSLGPDIRIGLIRLEGSKSDRTIKIRSVEGNYVVKNSAGETIKSVASNDSTTIKQSDNQFLIKGLDPSDLSVYVAKGDLLKIEPDGGEGIFEIYDCGAKFNYDADGKPDKVNPVGCYGDGEYNRFRGKLELSFDKNNDAWAINILPLEQYTWGTGEIGDLKYEYYKLFSIVFRTYGYRNMETKKTAHKNHNFDLSDTSLDQIYKGQKIESKYEDMKRATQETRGNIITYKGKTALTPYCSWSDGTRLAYGDYPYLEKMKDKYGKHPTKSSEELKADGNHMQGLIANGARKMVEDGKNYSEIIQYYYPGVKVEGIY